MHPSSVLFQDQPVPALLPVCDHYAGSEKLMRKSMALQAELGPCFDITFDCEDGAAAGNEAAHADLVSRLILSEENRFQRIGVRVHASTHPAFLQDLALIVTPCEGRLAYLVLPKVSNAAEILSAIENIRAHIKTDLPPVHVLIETHEALADVMAIAAIPEVQCLSFGIMDFVSSHFGAIPAAAMHSPQQFTHPLIVRAKTELAAACHRYGKIASHNVTTDISNPDAAYQDALLAGNQFGYQRMWSIHPQQIRGIVDAFAPSSHEITTATALLLQAQSADWGPVRFEGRLHDRASYRYYWFVLQRARLCAKPLPPEALELL